MHKIRLYLVDDHQIMREGLRLMLAREPDFAVVGEASDGIETLRHFSAVSPDLAVIDVELPGLNGIELAGRIRELRPETRAFMLSAAADVPTVHAALRAGVSGFMIKTGAARELVGAIRAIMAGEVYFCPQVTALLAQDYRRAIGVGPNTALALTEREADVLRWIADGASTKEIAFALQVSPKTVETHRANLMAKLGLFSIAGLTKYAIRAGVSKL